MLQQDVKCQNGSLVGALNEANKLCACIEKFPSGLQAAVSM